MQKCCHSPTDQLLIKIRTFLSILSRKMFKIRQQKMCVPFLIGMAFFDSNESRPDSANSKLMELMGNWNLICVHHNIFQLSSKPFRHTFNKEDCRKMVKIFNIHKSQTLSRNCAEKYVRKSSLGVYQCVVIISPFPALI